ncbi:MAG TPA: DUF58 domain-containing protein [Chthoniobacteraceae bacterium]|jgi:uncharacterized protein (DUF58 family)
MTTSSLLDPAALMAIRNLELRARTVVQGFWHGLHRSPYHGFSVEFTEYRAYSPGDDPRFLDWKLVARSDRYYVKKFEDETNLPCHLLVDNSRSMNFGSRSYTKADYAKTFAATLAYFLDQQGDAVGLLTFDEAVREYLPARHRPGHLRRLMLTLEKPALGASTNLASPLERMAALLRRRGMIVLVSDLLAPLDMLEASLGLLTAGGHEVLVFQPIDPVELNLAFDGPSRFVDLETDRDLFLDPELARADYQRRFEAHNARVRSIVERLGITLQTLVTDRPLELALFDFLRMRRERGKITVQRRRAA